MLSAVFKIVDRVSRLHLSPTNVAKAERARKKSESTKNREEEEKKEALMIEKKRAEEEKKRELWKSLSREEQIKMEEK